MGEEEGMDSCYATVLTQVKIRGGSRRVEAGWGGGGEEGRCRWVGGQLDIVVCHSPVYNLNSGYQEQAVRSTGVLRLQRRLDLPHVLKTKVVSNHFWLY